MASKTFAMITARPSKSDPYIYLYNNRNKKGGKSLCINGKPTDSVCNVLNNCVGWACARFNHIYNILTGYNDIKFPKFCCNAENFIEVAKAYGLSVGQTPKLGAIMCWQKGATLKSSDGAGHVAVVEKVISNTQVVTSESGYNSFTFANKNRSKGSDGRWGSGSAYTFRGFIYNPAVSDNVKPISITTCVARDTSVNQIQVRVDGLNVRVSPDSSADCLGFAKTGYYNYTETKVSCGYTWYKIGENNWIAYSSSWETIYPKQLVQPTVTFRIGDRVTIANNAPVYGKSVKFATWVYKSTLYVRGVAGDKITVSTVKTGAVTGSVDKKYLTKK